MDLQKLAMRVQQNRLEKQAGLSEWIDKITDPVIDLGGYTDNLFKRFKDKPTTVDIGKARTLPKHWLKDKAEIKNLKANLQDMATKLKANTKKSLKISSESAKDKLLAALLGAGVVGAGAVGYNMYTDAPKSDRDETDPDEGYMLHEPQIEDNPDLQKLAMRVQQNRLEKQVAKGRYSY